jgi:uracil-DNA glycosylase
VQAAPTARLCIASQAPGTRAHLSGRPFTDASGVRLRHWLGLDEATFYDATRIAIVPMGHCFPGHDRHGGDLPPRRECAETWRKPLLDALPHLALILLIGGHAQRWHLGPAAQDVTATVTNWRAIHASTTTPRLFPLPHPSWRNNRWLAANPWFDRDLLPVLRAEVARLVP